ncbi:MAG: hypothetical protein U5K54_17975 [Cytophagales bacterium]|nr:hypothetical protein [Cytophagales bacterium]
MFKIFRADGTLTRKRLAGFSTDIGWLTALYVGRIDVEFKILNPVGMKHDKVGLILTAERYDHNTKGILN